MFFNCGTELPLNRIENLEFVFFSFYFFFSFPNVSLMAVCSFIRMFDSSDKQIDELFTKFMLKQPTHLIVTESIFRIHSTSALIINTCGEATIMLNNLSNDSNITTDCKALAVALWTRLFKHINQTKEATHINLILDNVLQMMKIASTVSRVEFRLFEQK